jgi:hypothetical protein
MAESADHITEVAGWNEPEWDRGKEQPRPRNVWLPQVVENQRWLYHTAKATIPGVKVALGALRNVAETFPSDLQAMMNACEGYYDLVNLHMYPGNAPNIAQYIDERVALAHGRKVIITEFGGSPENFCEPSAFRVLLPSGGTGQVRVRRVFPSGKTRSCPRARAPAGTPSGSLGQGRAHSNKSGYAAFRSGKRAQLVVRGQVS